MTILEHELLETVKQLDTTHQEQVLAYARSLAQPGGPKLDWDDWLERAAAFQKRLRDKYGEQYYVGSAELLQEVREERLNDLMGGR
jgi:hypothetical protein